MAYQLLSVIQYNNPLYPVNEKQRYLERLNGDATLHTESYPNLMKRQESAGNPYPAFVVTTTEIQALIENLQHHSETIKTLMAQLPQVASRQFINQSLIHEINDTNTIESIESTTEEIGTTLEALTSGNLNPLKFGSIIKSYQKLVKKDPIQLETLGDIRALYDDLLENEIEKDKAPDGQYFRNGFVRIGSATRTVLLPKTTEEEIISQLNAWLNLIQRNDFNGLIKAFLSHYIFENTHPFYDGNGRTGRFILSATLSQKLDLLTGLTLSTAVNINRTKYYKAFETAQNLKNFGEATQFVRDLMQIVVEQQQVIIEQLNDKKEQFDETLQKIQSLSKHNLLRQEILSLLLQSQLFNNNPQTMIKDNDIIEALRQKNFSRDKIKAEIKQLTETGLIRVPKPRPTKKMQHFLNGTIFLENR